MQILYTLAGIIKESYSLLEQMAPYLMLGFFIAGVLHVIMQGKNMGAYLSKRSFMSNVKAAAFGVPLPLCSCGVIPVSAHLRKEGASKGSVVSFLVSTPTTGVDSIMATYSLLGPIFAAVRALASFAGGILAGTLIDIFDRPQAAVEEGDGPNVCPPDTADRSSSLMEKIREIFHYAFVEMISDVSKWILIGIAAGGLIGYFLPPTIFGGSLSNRFVSYAVMLIVGIPMYVCATGSIPIAASLIMKGMSYGAGLIFLIAGPATNTATMSFIAGKLGKKALALYLSSIIIISLASALAIDYLYTGAGMGMMQIHNHAESSVSVLSRIAAPLLLLLLVFPYINNFGRRQKMDMQIKVNDISCSHCKNTIENGLREIEGVESVYVDVKEKTVNIKGNPDRNKIIETIRNLGYTVL